MIAAAAMVWHICLPTTNETHHFTGFFCVLAIIDHEHYQETKSFRD
jgi:hypothetical protein